MNSDQQIATCRMFTVLEALDIIPVSLSMFSLSMENYAYYYYLRLTFDRDTTVGEIYND